MVLLCWPWPKRRCRRYSNHQYHSITPIILFVLRRRWCWCSVVQSAHVHRKMDIARLHLISIEIVVVFIIIYVMCPCVCAALVQVGRRTIAHHSEHAWVYRTHGRRRDLFGRRATGISKCTPGKLCIHALRCSVWRKRHACCCRGSRQYHVNNMRTHVKCPAQNDANTDTHSQAHEGWARGFCLFSILLARLRIYN